MKIRSALNTLFRVIVDEAEKNPDFEQRLKAALGIEYLSEERDQPGDRLEPIRGQRPRNRRPPPVLDPVEIAKSGEVVLRARLAELSIEQLKDIVAEFGMDPGKLVVKWKGTDRIIDRIVEVSIARSQKGQAFRG